MKVNVKRSDLFLMQGAIEVLARVKGSCKFAYAIAKNKKVIDDEVSSMRAGIIPSKDFMDYENKRIQLCEKFSDKDENGKAVIVNNAYQGLDSHKEFQEEMKAMTDANKGILGDRKKQLESFNDLIKEDVDIEFWAIKLTEIPDGITAESLGVIASIIVEE